MGRHRAPPPAHRAGSRTVARVVVVTVAVVTLVSALVLSTVAHRMSTDPVVSTPVPTFLTPSSSAPSLAPSLTPSRAPAPPPDCAAYGASMIPRSDPRYLPELDRDHDGIACDRHGDPTTPPRTMRSMAAHRPLV